MKNFVYLVASILLTSSTFSWGAAMVIVDFNSGSQLLRDSQGGLLTGGSTADGNGAVLQLGYYDGASTANNFLGTWVPLSGETSLNTAFNTTSVGDFDAEGAGNGTFAIKLTFEVGNSATGNNFPNSTSIPLSIRFFDSPTIESSDTFNVVSHDSWLWKTPTDPFNPVTSTILMSLDSSALEWEGGENSAFKTSLAVVPEPATGLAAMIGGVGLLIGYRRRRA